MSHYTLNNGVLVRKEWFGVLVCNARTGRFGQFNRDAFEILKEIRVPRTIDQVQEKFEKLGLEISRAHLTAFLEELCEEEFVAISDQALSSYIFFENLETFREDCLVSPSAVTLYLTEWCPKQCLHCVVRSSPFVVREGELSIADWKEVIDKLRAFGVLALVFTGGEPFAKQGLFDILQHADDLCFAITLLTDYDGLRDEHLERLAQLKHLVDIQVSLDGGKEATHDYIRGKGAFKKALQRLGLLQRHGIPYTISTTVGTHNIGELDQLVHIAREYGAGYFYINPLAPYGRAKEKLTHQLLSSTQLQWLGEKYHQLVMEGSVDPGNPFWFQEGNKTHAFEKALTAVSLGVYNFSIGSTGDCYLDSKVKSEDILKLGNALSDDIEGMWYDPRLDKLRAFSQNMQSTFAEQSKVFK